MLVRCTALKFSGPFPDDICIEVAVTRRENSSASVSNVAIGIMPGEAREIPYWPFWPFNMALASFAIARFTAIRAAAAEGLLNMRAIST